MTPTLEQTLDALTEALAADKITLEEWHLAVAHALADALGDQAGDALRQLNALAGDLAAAPNVDADQVEARLRALVTTPPTNVGVPIGITGATLAFFQAAFARERSGATLNVPRLADSVFARYRDYYQAATNKLTDAYTGGQISVDEWHTAMAHEVTNVNATAYLVGRGGPNALDAQDGAIMNEQATEQLGFLSRWADQLRGGSEPSADAMKARAQMYMNSADAMLQRGVTEALGMPKLPAYPKNWSTDCGSNCYCHWEIHRLDGDGNWDCIWVYDPEKNNCLQCPLRAEVWAPLKIRGGEILSFDPTGLFAAHSHAA